MLSRLIWCGFYSLCSCNSTENQCQRSGNICYRLLFHLIHTRCSISWLLAFRFAVSGSITCPIKNGFSIMVFFFHRFGLHSLVDFIFASGVNETDCAKDKYTSNITINLATEIFGFAVKIFSCVCCVGFCFLFRGRVVSIHIIRKCTSANKALSTK